jgi:hypothetical protein
MGRHCQASPATFHYMEAGWGTWGDRAFGTKANCRSENWQMNESPSRSPTAEHHAHGQCPVRPAQRTVMCRYELSSLFPIQRNCPFTNSNGRQTPPRPLPGRHHQPSWRLIPAGPADIASPGGESRLDGHPNNAPQSSCPFPSSGTSAKSVHSMLSPYSEAGSPLATKNRRNGRAILRET